MKVCVVGCGAVGGQFAAHLGGLEDVEVWAYDVSPEHVEAINREGLRLTGSVERKARVRASTDAARIPPCDLGIVATKATATRAAIEATAAIFSDGAVCSVQNGLGAEDVIAEHVPRVIRGVTLAAGRVSAPGVVHMDAPGITWIAPFEPRPASTVEVRRLAGALTRGGMRTEALGDARGAQWTKLLFNAATNPLAALTGLTHGEVCERPGLRETSRALVAEGRAVAEALAISLDDDPDAMIDRAAIDNHGHKPSMLQDVLARRPTEIAALNGAVARAGREAGVATPLHAAVTALIEGLESGWRS